MSVGSGTLVPRAVIINLTRKREGGIKGGEIIDMDYRYGRIGEAVFKKLFLF